MTKALRSRWAVSAQPYKRWMSFSPTIYSASLTNLEWCIEFSTLKFANRLYWVAYLRTRYSSRSTPCDIRSVETALGALWTTSFNNIT